MVMFLILEITCLQLSRFVVSLLVSFKVAGNHVNEIHDFCKQLNISRLGCLCRRHFTLHFACLPIDIEHGKF